MTVEMEVLQIIQNEFSKAKLKNPSYSLRAFAKRLNLSPAAVSGILNQKLRITKKAAERVFYNIHVEPEKKKQILGLLSNKCRGNEKMSRTLSDEAFTLVDMDQYHLISEWYFFAVLSLAETPDFSDEPKWIASRLGIQIRQARKALVILERLKLLERNKRGLLCWTGKAIRTTSNTHNAAIRKSHTENLDLARRSLEQDAVEDCDFTAITMAIDPAKINEAKEKIKNFRRELCQYLESSNKKEVFKLVVQLFPLSGRK